MTPVQEEETVAALKSIAHSLEQLAQYAVAVTQIKLGIAPTAIVRLANPRPRR